MLRLYIMSPVTLEERPVMHIPYVIDNQTHTLAEVLRGILREQGGRALGIATAYFSVSGYKELRGAEPIGSGDAPWPLCP